MADIFISYARPDRVRIETLAAKLAEEGYSVWWDRQIGGGAEFSQAIEAELETAKTVIVGWSAHSLGSHWVRDEADFARGRHKLLPISLDGVLAPLGFRQLHTLDFSGWNQSGDDSVFRELVLSLGATLQHTSAAVVPVATGTSPGARPAGRPCIAVLPFANMSSDEELEYLADGLTEDIITLLSSNRHLSVPARTSVFVFKGQSVDIRGVGEALGARYIVEGSLRKMGARVRVTVQFIAADSGEHIWAKKFDVLFEELSNAPDETVEKIAGSLFAQLTWAEADRSEQALVDELGAWEYCQRSAARIGRAIGAVKTFHRVEAELELALSIAPDYALAHALHSWGCNAAIINGIYEDDQLAGYIDKAKYHLGRARELARDDLLTQIYIGASENFAGMHNRALQTLEQVIARNPASAEAWYVICQVYSYLGRFDDARQAITRASELAPEGGFAPLHAWYRGLAEFLAGDYAVAAPLLERKALEQPEYGYVNILSALCEESFGNHDAARKFIARAQEHNPQLRPDKVAGMLLTQFDRDKGQREYTTLKKLWSASAA
ncbi:MAG: TIR domain-containing protein [Gammaproteobacteria bacterium]|nr:TIR domain-containing protein [Gammaproteobacteria bacterium]